MRLSGAKSSKYLGELVRTIESELRKRNGFQRPLKAEEPPRQLKTIISKTLEEIARQVQLEQKRHIEIDLSKLEGIRRASDSTREKLIVDEEELAEINAPDLPENPEPEPSAEPADTPLSAAE